MKYVCIWILNKNVCTYERRKSFWIKRLFCINPVNLQISTVLLIKKVYCTFKYNCLNSKVCHMYLEGKSVICYLLILALYQFSLKCQEALSVIWVESCISLSVFTHCSAVHYSIAQWSAWLKISMKMITEFIFSS